MTQRDDRGRFVAGHSIKSPGRPRRVIESEYHARLVGRVSITKWEKIVDKAVVDALEGDRHARTFLADYILGKPLQILELRGESAHLLAELLDQWGQRGISPAEVFAAMIEEMMLESEVADDGSE